MQTIDQNNFINKHDGFFSDYGKSQMFFKYFDDIISRKLVIETISNKQEEVDYEYTIDENKIPDGLKGLIDKYISKDESLGNAKKDITGNFIYNFQRYIYAKHGATLFDTNKDVFDKNLIDIINKECEVLEESKFFDDQVDISKLLGKNGEFLVSKACFNCLPSRFLTKILEDKPETVDLVNTRKIDLDFIQNKIEKINEQDDFLGILKNMDPIKDIDDMSNNNNTENLVQIKYLLQPAHFYPIKKDGTTVKGANATPYWDGSRTIAFPDFYNPRYTHNGFDFSDTGTVATNGRVENSDLGYIFYIAGLMDNIDKTKLDFNLSSYILDHKTREDIIKMTEFISNNTGKINKILGIKIDVIENKNELAFGLPKISITHNFINKSNETDKQNINIDFVCMLEKDVYKNRIKNVFSDSVKDISKAVDWIGKNRQIIFDNRNNNGSIYSCAQGMSRSNLTGTIINSIKYVEGVRRGLIVDEKMSAQLKVEGVRRGLIVNEKMSAQLKSGKTADLIIFDLVLKNLKNSGMELSFIHSVTGPDHHAAMSGIVAGPNKKAKDEIKKAVNEDVEFRSLNNKQRLDYQRYRNKSHLDKNKNMLLREKMVSLYYGGLGEAEKGVVDSYKNVQTEFNKEISKIYQDISNMESFNVGDLDHKQFKNDLVDQNLTTQKQAVLHTSRVLDSKKLWFNSLNANGVNYNKAYAQKHNKFNHF